MFLIKFLMCLYLPVLGILPAMGRLYIEQKITRQCCFGGLFMKW